MRQIDINLRSEDIYMVILSFLHFLKRPSSSLSLYSRTVADQGFSSKSATLLFLHQTGEPRTLCPSSPLLHSDEQPISL